MTPEQLKGLRERRLALLSEGAEVIPPEETLLAKNFGMDRLFKPPSPSDQVIDYICESLGTSDSGYVRRILQEDWYHCINITDDYYTMGVCKVEKAREGYPLIGKDKPDLTGKTAIDLGSSECFFSFALEEKGAKVTALEFTKLCVDHANFIKRIKNSEVDIKHMNVFSKELKKFGKFNIVWATSILQHLTESENTEVDDGINKFIQTLYDLCDWENDGTLVISYQDGKTDQAVNEFFSSRSGSFYKRSYNINLDGTHIRPSGTSVRLFEIKKTVDDNIEALQNGIEILPARHVGGGVASSRWNKF